MPHTRLVYVSNHHGATTQAIMDILQTSRVNNDRDEITGALICSEQDFIQLLEGERTAVAACFMRIILDVRHRNIQVIYANDSEIRLFPDWSMYSVKASRIRRRTMARYLINGSFEPARMSAVAISDMYDDLSTERAANNEVVPKL